MNTIRIVTHYCPGNKDGDYVSVDVVLNNRVVKSYGDHYHDEGSTKAEAFVEGLQFLNQNCGWEVLEEDVDDAPREYCE